MHIAISYYADGRIAAYRDGKPYGKPYQSNGPLKFAVGEAIVSFGVRHLPAVGNRLLSGKIYQARLYDRALTDEEIEASFLTSHISLSQSRLMESITSEEREEVLGMVGRAREERRVGESSRGDRRHGVQRRRVHGARAAIPGARAREGGERRVADGVDVPLAVEQGGEPELVEHDDDDRRVRSHVARGRA